MGKYKDESTPEFNNLSAEEKQQYLTKFITWFRTLSAAEKQKCETEFNNLSAAEKRKLEAAGIEAAIEAEIEATKERAPDCQVCSHTLSFVT